MRSPEDIEEERAEEYSDVEIKDLDQEYATLHSSRLPWSGNVLLRWQRRLTRKHFHWFTAASMGLMIVLMVVLNIPRILPMLHTTAPSLAGQSARADTQLLPGVSIKPEMVILPEKDGLGCLTDVAWSPNGERIALLGYQQACNIHGQGEGPGLVVVHDAAGSVVMQISPDAMIWPVFHKQFPGVQGVLNYTQIVWSSDGRRLAISFFSENSSNGAALSGYDGVLLVGGSAVSVQTQILIQPQTNVFASLEWDLERGKLVNNAAIASIVNAPTVNGELPTVYEWGIDGSLRPQMRYYGRVISPPDSEFAPIGNPIGGSSFTIWQSGMVFVWPYYMPIVYLWSTEFAAWSPDQRYLATLDLYAWLELTGEPAPNHESLVALHMDNAPVLRVRDMALHRIVGALSDGSTNADTNQVVWRPDGRELATYDLTNADVDVFDCATGYQVASLILPTSSRFVNEGFGTLRWSPDGSRVLFFDSQVGSVAIWKMGH